VKTAEAVALLEAAIPRAPGVWADLGCGDGLFTQALVELLGPGGRVYAVDRDRQAIASLQRRLANVPNVLPVLADFTRPFELPEHMDGRLDGILLANSLHYVRDAKDVLSRLVGMVAPGGRVVLIEYDGRAANPWVPYPIGIERWNSLTAAAGLSTPVITAKRSSRFGGDLYVAAAERPPL